MKEYVEMYRNENPLVKLDEFLRDSFLCRCGTINSNLFYAYLHSVDEINKTAILAYVDNYARRNKISECLKVKLKREVSQMIDEFLGGTNEALGGSLKK